MTGAQLIETLVGVLILMVGAFYANFMWEMRKVRENLHEMRARMGELVAKVYFIEKHLKINGFKDK